MGPDYEFGVLNQEKVLENAKLIEKRLKKARVRLTCNNVGRSHDAKERDAWICRQSVGNPKIA
jgi:hypothetical protein